MASPKKMPRVPLGTEGRINKHHLQEGECGAQTKTDQLTNPTFPSPGPLW